MRFFSILTTALSLGTAAALSEPLDVEVQKSTECDRKTKIGDRISMHYRGTLGADGSEFDASYNRGKPLDFVLGKGQVIKGWDEGLQDMCIGDKRKLTIQPEWGYGQRAMGPIPAGSTLVFETELVGIQGVQPKEEL